MNRKIQKALRHITLLGALLVVVSCGSTQPEQEIRFKTLTGQLDALVQNGTMPGSVTYIVEQGKPVFHYVNGYRDVDSQIPMTDDTLFRWYSMSKPVTSVAIMLLQEQGKLAVTDPIEKFIPAFADVRVYESGTLDNMVTVQPVRSMTIGDLLAHK